MHLCLPKLPPPTILTMRRVPYLKEALWWTTRKGYTYRLGCDLLTVWSY